MSRKIVNYADDIVAFDAVSALQFKGGKAAIAQSALEESVRGFLPGPWGLFDFHEVRILAGDNSAFAHWLAHCMAAFSGPTAYSRPAGCASATANVGGEWKVVHEHWSAPFDMGKPAPVCST